MDLERRRKDEGYKNVAFKSHANILLIFLSSNIRIILQLKT